MVSPYNAGYSSGYQNNSLYSNYLPPMMAGGQSAQQMFGGSASYRPPEEKKKGGGGIFGAVGGFVKGVVKGATNLVTSLKDPKNLLMAIGGIALTVVCPPAGIALASIGMATGGLKMAQSAAAGDWEGMGEGAFTVGASYLAKKGLTKGGSVTNASGQSFQLAGAGEKAGLMAKGKNFFNPKLTAADGSTTSLYAVGKGDLTHAWGNNPKILAAREFGSNAVGKGKGLVKDARTSFSEGGGFAGLKAKGTELSKAARTSVQKNGWAATAKSYGKQGWSVMKGKYAELRGLMAKKANGTLTATEEAQAGALQSEIGQAGGSNLFSSVRTLGGQAVAKGTEYAKFGYNHVKTHPHDTLAVIGGGTGLGVLGQEQQQYGYA